MHRGPIALLLAIAALACAGAGNASAATFAVTTTADTDDGACTAVTCSLRDAVIASNATTGPNTITLPAGTYTLTIPGQNQDANHGDLDITQTVAINGAGAAQTTIDGGGIDRIAHVVCVSVSTCSTGLTFTGVTLRGGKPGPVSAGGAVNGGAILFETQGTLAVDNSVLSGNTAGGPSGGYGGAIAESTGGATMTLTGTTLADNRAGGSGDNDFGYGGAIYSYGSIDATDGTFSGNHAGGGGAFGYGGAIDLTSSNGTLNFTRVTFSSNTAGGGNYGYGGAVESIGPLTATDSTFTTNHAGGGPTGTSIYGYGGAIDAQSSSDPITLVRTKFASNTAGGNGDSAYGYGGAIDGPDGGDVTATDSSFTGNSAGGNGTSAYGYGGAVSIDTGSLITTRSTFTGNQAGGGADGAYGYGGAANLFAGDDTATDSSFIGNRAGGNGANAYGYGGGLETSSSAKNTATNTTISDNRAGGGGGYGYGGGVDGSITLSSSTVAGNSATVVSESGGGGGIYGALTTHNSIISGNSSATGPNCAPGTATSQGHNIEQGTSCGLAGSGDLNADPLLAPLADNGGLTQTRALAPGSPAIDAGDNAGCPATDQRGVARPRPAGGLCDIGAFEFQPSVVTGISPASGPATGGTVVTISGSGFTGVHAVNFGSTPSPTVTVDNDGQITAESPAGSGTVDVTVIGPAGPSATVAADRFTFLPGPTVVAGKPSVRGTRGARFTGTVNPNGLSTTAHFEYGLDPKVIGTRTLVYDQRTPDQLVGSDTSPHTVSARVSGLIPNARYHVRLVATNSVGTTFGSDQTFKTAQDPPPPQPTLGKTFNVQAVSGHVFIKPPPGHTFAANVRPIASAAALVKGNGFVPLTEARQIPSGSQIDARAGTLQLTSATGAKHGKTIQKGTFTGGLYTLQQTRTGLQKGLTTLSLLNDAFPGAPSLSTCPKHASTDSRSGPLAHQAVSSPVLQTLHARDHHGHFRTRTHSSAGTSRGTDWTTIDRCDGTLTIVHRGTVDLFDFGKRKTITLHAGQRYLAKRRKP